MLCRAISPDARLNRAGMNVTGQAGLGLSVGAYRRERTVRFTRL